VCTANLKGGDSLVACRAVQSQSTSDGRLATLGPLSSRHLVYYHDHFFTVISGCLWWHEHVGHLHMVDRLLDVLGNYDADGLATHVNLGYRG
jgi:hypothetical protein